MLFTFYSLSSFKYLSICSMKEKAGVVFKCAIQVYIHNYCDKLLENKCVEGEM